MEDITLQELKAQDGERLLPSRNPSWQEELAASRREHDRIIARLDRSMDDLNRQLSKLGNAVALHESAFYPSLLPIL